MPIYEYRCRMCEHVFEALRPLGDQGEDLTCPVCGTESPEKVVSVFAARAAAGGGCGGGGGFT